MRALSVTILLFLFSLPASPQEFGEVTNYGHEKKDICNTRVQSIDSVINFSYNQATNQYTGNYVLVYNLDRDGNPDEIIKLSLPDRNPINRQLYVYDMDGRKILYTYQVWDGGWKDFQATEFIYDSRGALQEEIFYSLGENGQETAYQHHFYFYSDGTVIDFYLRKMRDGNGNWYDFSNKIYSYNDEGKLSERIEQRISDNVIFWREYFVYDSDGKTVERFRQKLKYDRIEGKWLLKDDTHQIYNYDIYGDISEVHQDNMYEDNWLYVGKNVYYRSIIHGKKVCLCHKGKMIIVSANAVEAHLMHGDQLGECPTESNVKVTIQENDPIVEIRTYPNPFSNHFTVELDREDHPFESLTIYSYSGIPVLSTDIRGKTQVNIEIGNQREGIYYLRFTGSGIERMITSIKK